MRPILGKETMSETDKKLLLVVLSTKDSERNLCQDLLTVKNTELN